MHFKNNHQISRSTNDFKTFKYMASDLILGYTEYQIWDSRSIIKNTSKETFTNLNMIQL